MVFYGQQQYKALEVGRGHHTKESFSLATALTCWWKFIYHGEKEAWVEIKRHINLRPTCLRASEPKHSHAHLKLYLEQLHSTLAKHYLENKVTKLHTML